MKVKMRKRLSDPGLLEAIRVRFSRLKDPLGRKTKYPLGDCLMSALAMFSLKYHSFLQFEQGHCTDKKVRHNLQSLYGVVSLPRETVVLITERLCRRTILVVENKVKS